MGRPSKGTPADRRLKENTPAKPMRRGGMPAKQQPKQPRRPRRG